MRGTNRSDLGLGEEFMRAVEARIAEVAQRPESFHRATTTMQRAMARRFPYGVFYTLEDDDTVIIKAILHASRRPGLWRRRR